MTCSCEQLSNNMRKFVAAWTPNSKDTWKDIETGKSVSDYIDDAVRKKRVRADFMIVIAMLGCRDEAMPKGWSDMPLHDLARVFCE